MKRILQIIYILITALSTTTTIDAADYVTIYSSWDKILYDEPDTVLTQIGIEISSPYCINIKPQNGKDKVAKDILKNQALAVAVNDSVWFVNTNFLKKNYTGFALPYMSNYAPLYFNDKIAYTQYTNDIDNSFLYELSNNVVQGMSTTEALKFLTSYGFNFENAYIFLIDPHTKRVDALNDAKMSQLLQPYLDLRKRYESMYFYNEPFVINYFFLEYIDRIDQDPFMKSLVE
ncbi:MAG: DUF6563 family protein [Muribaculaceae bacterium]